MLRTPLAAGALALAAVWAAATAYCSQFKDRP
jgi:hypothetical protein